MPSRPHLVLPWWTFERGILSLPCPLLPIWLKEASPQYLSFCSWSCHLNRSGFVATLLIARAWVLTRRHLSDWQGAAVVLQPPAAVPPSNYRSTQPGGSAVSIYSFTASTGPHLTASIHFRRSCTQYWHTIDSCVDRQPFNSWATYVHEVRCAMKMWCEKQNRTCAPTCPLIPLWKYISMKILMFRTNSDETGDSKVRW